MSGLLRLVSTVATVFVVLGFVMFAADETREGSAATVSRLAEASGERGEQRRESRNGGFREFVDDVNDVLLAPFDGVTSSSGSEWVRHGVPALLGFLVYGLLLRLLANVAPKPRRPEPLGWDVPR